MGDYSDSSEESDGFSPLTSKSAKVKEQTSPIANKKRSKTSGRYLSETMPFGTSNPRIGNDSLIVEPSSIRFDSIKPGVLYAMTFSLRNATKTAQRIRIQPPRSPWFALNYIPTTLVAPGLDIRAEIECQIPKDSSDMSFSDVIVASMGPHSVEIPLFASKPHARVKFNSVANMGYVAMGQFTNFDVYFFNDGDVPAVLNFKQNVTGKAKLSSTKLELQPQERERIVLTYEAKELGVHREVIEVQIQGALNNEIIDVSVQVVDQKLSVLGPNHSGILDTFDFGSMFYGQKKSVTAILANTGPQAVSFNITFSEDDDGRVATGDASHGGAEPENDDSNSLEKKLSVYPVEGIVPPFSELPLTLKFEPTLVVPKSGFLQQFTAEAVESKQVGRRVQIESTETGEKYSLYLQGTVMLPDVLVSSDFLDFGDCPVNDRRDIRLSIINKSTVKASFEFARNAQFKFTPNKGNLQPQQTVSIVASFLPTQLGIFKPTLNLSIANGLKEFPIRMYGEANITGPKRQYVSGTDKLPEDFMKEFKFVDPVKLEETRRDKLRASTMTSSDKSTSSISDLLPSINSHERDVMYGLVESKSRSISMDEDHPFFTRKVNEKVFNTYLQESRKDRTKKKHEQAKRRILERGGPDRENPNGVDLGMARGLNEPALQLPVGGEGLWSTNRAGDGDRGNARSRIPIDENRLIVKKYRSTPATQAEMKDCSAELNADDQKLVFASHKILDYGRVCVNSVVAKNFVITNDLSHSILASVIDLEPELKQSKPEAQVIPKGAIAGFDLLFCSKVLGKYKKTFTWNVNGKHNHKVTVLAEVVPIELLMNTDKLVFEFASDSLDAFVTRDLVLTNPGNAPAEFLWGNTGSFECKPDRGVIEAGQKAVINITWTPTNGHRNEEEMGLHIPGGVDKTLKVEGIMKEAKAEFEERKINISSIAVGLEKKITIHVKNPGVNPAVFYVNPLEDKYGIRTVPDRAIVQGGDMVPVDVYVAPKVPLTYDVSLSAHIRGGKSISLRVSGESIVPNVSLEQSSFSFGTVAVNSHYLLPFNLTNNSQITACLTLDLTKYTDFVPFLPSLNGELYPQSEILSIQIDKSAGRIERVSMDQNGTLVKALSQSSNVWKISINGGATLKAYLIYIPSFAKNFSFPLPLYLTGLMGDARFNLPVTAEGIATRLEVSTKFIDFGDRVVSRDPMSRNSYFLEFSLKNVDVKKGFAFEIREHATYVTLHSQGDESSHEKQVSVEEEGPPVFFTSPVRNDLPAGGNCAIRVTFMPRINGDYEKRLDVYISNQPDMSRPYISLYVKGSGVFPKIAFDRTSIALPTVPLGVTSRATFTILNKGYASVELRHSLSPVIPLPLQLTFPDGLDLNPAKNSIRVVVAMTAETPVSWTGKLEFYDEDGERFAVTLSGCADNCILTTYSFVHRYADMYGYLGLDNQPVRLLKKNMILELRTLEAKRKEQLRKQRMLERQKQAEIANHSHDKDDKHGSNNSPKKPKKKEMKPGDESLKPSDIEKLSLQEKPMDDGTGGIDMDREARLTQDSFAYIDSEVRFLLKWMNQFVCRRPFDHERFPECIVDNHGDVIVDCIEQISGRKISGVKTAAEIENTGSGGTAAIVHAMGMPSNHHSHQTHSSHTGSSPIARCGKVLTKYQTVLNFLVRGGALLNHINPVALLNLDDHLIAQEAELKRNEGNRVTVSRLNELKAMWTDTWAMGCKLAWADVLFQIMKIYMLSRVNYKDFTHMPGVVMTSKEDLNSNDKGKNNNGSGGNQGKNKKKGPQNPPEYNGSNVYSSSEAVLLAWVSYHIQKSSNLRDDGASGEGSAGAMGLFGINKRACDFEAEFKDLFGFCQIFHSHLPNYTKPEGPISGYTEIDKTNKSELFQRLQRSLTATRLDFQLDLEDLHTARTMLLMSLHLFLNLPQMIPKSKIEFKGLLGASIQKVIELRNPSKKRVTYQVTVTGSSDFQIEMQEFTIPPESMFDYKVSLNPRFSETSHATIIFWGVRDCGVAGSNLVFSLTSVITGRKPIESVHRNLGVFDIDNFTINIVNPFDQPFNCPVRLYLEHVPSSVEEVIKGHANKRHKQTGMSKLMKGDDQQADKEELENGKSMEDIEIEKLYKRPIWCSETGLQLPPKGSKPVQIQMLPFLLGTYNAQIVLLDENVGEYCYDIVANVGLPKATDRLEYNCAMSKDGASIAKALRVASKNSAFEKALNFVSENHLSNPAKKTKARMILQNLMNSPIHDNETGSSIFLIDSLSPLFSVIKQVNFVSEYMMMPMVNGRPATVPAKYKKLSRTVLEAPTNNDLTNIHASMNTTLVTLSPEKAGTYHSKLIVYSKENKNDIRVVEITANATVPDSKMTIEFKGPARQRLIQEIPILNNSNKDWILSAHINGKAFTGPKTISVPKGLTVNYSLTFFGICIGSFDGTLQFRNSEGGDSFEYTLIGVSEEPLAEDHLHFKCKARSKQPIAIPVMNVATMPKKERRNTNNNNNNNNNNSKESNDEREEIVTQRFFVETDLPYCAGPTTIDITNNVPTTYNLIFSSPVGGLVTGSVVFTDEEGSAMFWYTLEVDVTSPAPERTIRVESVVRKAVAVEISLDNPTDERLEFTVKFSGEGLLGDSVFALPAIPSNSMMEDEPSDKYELIYSPLYPGETKGRISFHNEKVGEFWYELQLVALPAEPTVLETIEAMIGSNSSISVPIDNPLPQEVTLEVEISDSEHFEVIPNKITLAPYAQSSFNLCFTPTSLVDLKYADIKFTHIDFGELEFKASGLAVMPGVMPVSRVYAPLGDLASHTLNFRNPFNHPLPVDIVMNEEMALPSIGRGLKSQGTSTTTSSVFGGNSTSPTNISANNAENTPAFALLLKKGNDIVIPAKTNLNITYSFSPNRLGEYRANLQVRSGVSGKSLQWTFPIVGMAEASTPQELEPIVAPCKTSVLRDIDVPLMGLYREDLPKDMIFEASDFQIDTKVDDKDRMLVARSFRFQVLEVVELENTTHTHTTNTESSFASITKLVEISHKKPPQFSLKCRLLFEPLKNYNTSLEISILLKNRGRWRLALELYATDPEPDDTISLIAPIHGVDKVSFRLNNRFLGFSTFQAYFSAKSSSHFHVSPSQGVLAPYGAEGTQFVVTYAPLSYGTLDSATLIVTTEETQWNYKIIGQFPDRATMLKLKKPQN